ncbi:MAG: multicopper oxidase domain-containing protein [Snowella sp.]|nr:multicopper oxidase domain-containing protein [Snowella sp.]
MSIEPKNLWLSNRRQFLQWGLGVGAGLGAGVAAWNLLENSRSSQSVVPDEIQSNLLKNSKDLQNPLIFLRNFDHGTLKQENGRTIREFRVEARTSPLQLNKAVSMMTWNLNGQVPGPTFRATEGDRIRVIFSNRAGHSHSLHFHGVHPAAMDGIKPVRNNQVFIYEFDAEPYGVHLYHCHISPVTRHISKGLYGMFIVDPPQPRPQADEMVMIMGGYDVNEDRKNELFAFNGLPNYYNDNPIAIKQNQLVRLYLLNMIEYDPTVTFHIHANFFQVYPTGMAQNPSQTTDVITMGTAERHILEFSYREPGMYMFHPHQDWIAESGCMGMFKVVENA